MKKFLKLSFMVVLTVALFTGCRTNPVRNYDSEFLTNSSQVALDEISKEIVSAGASLGWQMKPVKDGQILATLYLRTHVAQVNIYYTKNTFNIVYKSSTNLKYDADAKTIHSNYNGWVQNLNNAIQTRLAML